MGCIEFMFSYTELRQTSYLLRTPQTMSAKKKSCGAINDLQKYQFNICVYIKESVMILLWHFKGKEGAVTSIGSKISGSDIKQDVLAGGAQQLCELC